MELPERLDIPGVPEQERMRNIAGRLGGPRSGEGDEEQGDE